MTKPEPPFAPTPPLPAPTILPTPPPAPPPTAALAWDGKHPDSAKWSKLLRELILKSKLPDVALNAVDAEVFFKGYTHLSREAKAEYWAKLFAIITKYECSYNPSEYSVDVGSKDKPETWSVGLFQLSVVDQKNYHFNLGYDFKALQNGEKNITLAVLIAEKLVSQDGMISAHIGGAWRGLPRYWGTLRDGKESRARIVAYMRTIDLSGIPVAPVPVSPQPVAAVPSGGFPWLVLAKSDIGQREIPGPQDNQVILGYFKHTNTDADHDEVANCAAGVCAWVERSGYKSAHSANAFKTGSYSPVCPPRQGAIALWQHLHGTLKGHYHVNIIDEVAATGCWCVGANQGDEVNRRFYAYADHNLVRQSWPEKVS